MFELSTVIAVAGFSLVTSVTPGPNTLMLASSGAAYGFNRTIPHLFGVNLGILVMMLVAAAGIGEIFATYPSLQVALKYIATGYLGYLTWKLMCGGALPEASPTAKPVSFFQAIMLQWLNPKVWMMAVVAMTTFTQSGDHYLASAVVVAMIMALVNLPSIFLWAAGGCLIKQLLKSKLHTQIFNWSMASLMLIAIAAFWLE